MIKPPNVRVKARCKFESLNSHCKIKKFIICNYMNPNLRFISLTPFEYPVKRKRKK